MKLSAAFKYYCVKITPHVVYDVLKNTRNLLCCESQHLPFQYKVQIDEKDIKSIFCFYPFIPDLDKILIVRLLEHFKYFDPDSWKIKYKEDGELYIIPAESIEKLDEVVEEYLNLKDVKRKLKFVNSFEEKPNRLSSIFEFHLKCKCIQIQPIDLKFLSKCIKSDRISIEESSLSETYTKKLIIKGLGYTLYFSLRDDEDLIPEPSVKEKFQGQEKIAVKQIIKDLIIKAILEERNLSTNPKLVCLSNKVLCIEVIQELGFSYKIEEDKLYITT